METVKVPAGEFQAYRIEHKGTSTAVGRAGYGTWKATYWYVPQLHTMVASETESRSWGRVDTEREELTSFSLLATASRH